MLRSAAAGARLPYLPGLDGLRAVAVGAVLLYHAGVAWLPGGFLGVEVFFVISGYLITGLLLAEWEQRKRIAFARFWGRRARRLLPALFLLLAVTLTVFVLVAPGEVARVRGDALAACLYVTNWYYIVRQVSYFEAVGRPSPFQHLWSLAIEEQFYLVWPLVLAVALRRWPRRRVLGGILAGAVASWALMALLYRPGADPSRVYYGTDTRAAGLLVGAALAFAWAPWRERQREPWVGRAVLDLAGLGALGALVWLMTRLTEYQPFLYRGGFTLVALATAAVIALAVAPRARLLPGLLETPPLRWVGVRSYGIYLWHWPVFVLTRPHLDLPFGGAPALLLRLALAVGLAALSYRYVETPIRGGALGRAVRAAWAAPRGRRAFVRLWVGPVAAGVAFCTVLGVAVASAKPAPPPSYLATTSVLLTIPAAGAAGAPNGTPVSAAAANDAGRPAPPGAPRATAAGGPEPTCPPAEPHHVTAIGDSVMVGAADALASYLGPGVTIDAHIGRQASQVPTVIRERRGYGDIGDIVVIDIGTNGGMTDGEFDAIMAELEGVRAVLFVNVLAPRPWEGPNNAILADGVGRYPNALLIDWHREGGGHPEYLAPDGIHLSPQGQNAYSSMIATQVQLLEQRWAGGGDCVPGGGQVDGRAGGIATWPATEVAARGSPRLAAKPAFAG
ncbi:MAG TPA: acyltransferase family protein [Thermomicrobiales bacterium]|nr:acyltransferase family protein [Thermomicrobiales bacterium]